MIVFLILFVMVVLFLAEQSERRQRHEKLRIRDTHGESNDNSPPRD